MSKQSFIVSLIPQTPIEFIDIFSDYLGPRWRGVYHFYAHSIEHVHPFVEVLAIPFGDSGSPQKIYVPSNYILAISDIGEGKPPLGFRADKS